MLEERGVGVEELIALDAGICSLSTIFRIDSSSEKDVLVGLVVLETLLDDDISLHLEID